MAVLSTDQREKIEVVIQEEWGTCYNCMPYENGEPVWIVPHEDLGSILLQAFEDSGVSEEVNFESFERLAELIQELQLMCPECGTQLTSESDELGQHFSSPSDDCDDLNDEVDSDDLDSSEESILVSTLR